MHSRFGRATNSRVPMKLGDRHHQIRTAGATFKATPPARILDTRTGNGLSGKFTANAPRLFQVTGRGGIPANAIAVTGNLTVTGQSAAGYVSLTPTATATPKTSTLNMPAGDNRANAARFPLGPGGKLAAVYKAGSGGTTHLIFDVTGYFVRSSAGSTYFSFAPVRLLDTRIGNGLTGTFTANTPRTWAIAGLAAGSRAPRWRSPQT